MTETAHATPAKEFFIRMITKDIALDDCVLDLLDNSIDGAKREMERRDGSLHAPSAYAGFEAAMTFSEQGFRIQDDCGGISIDEAKDYAFHFGRRKGLDRQPQDSIGIYGIGMKRAIFKIGRQIKVRSSTSEESFEVSIDVDEWETKLEWEFELEPGEPWTKPGTTIEVTELNSGAKLDFADPAFANQLRSTVARDYSLFIQKGFRIAINSAEVPPLGFSLRYGADFEPAKVAYVDRREKDGAEISVEIAAGMAALPPDPDEDLAQINLKDVDRYGWFVLCNDRVVLAGDKTDKTVWGDNGYRRWHPQYNGFLGIAQFHSRDPGALPWTTTKRDVDETDPVYRRAVARMKELTTPYIEYTNARKADPDSAKRLEQETQARPIAEVQERREMRLPVIARPRIKMRNVLYRKPEDELLRAAEALGDAEMSFKEIGLRTFDYYYDREVGE